MNDQSIALPLCNFRENTPTPSVYYCRHENVRAYEDLVTSEICNGCGFCGVSCQHPRPSKIVEQKPPPTLARQAWSFGSAVAAFVADGLKTVSTDEYAVRILVCDTCLERKGNTCLQCGCRLSWKARGRAFDCPLGKWPELRSRPPESQAN